MVGALLKNLRLRLLFLVLVAVLPALGLLIVTASEQRDRALANARAEASRLASLAAGNEERLVDGTRQLLVVLSQLPEVRSGDVAACQALLADLLADFPLYANLGVIAPDGFLTCSAIPASGPLDLSDRTYFQQAVQTRDFAVGEWQIGRITGLATINCGYPVLDADGQLVAVVFAALSLAWLNDFAAQADLPPDAVLTVLDRSGRVLIRQPAPASTPWVGRSLLGTPVVDTILAEGSGVIEAAGDGGAYLYAFVPLGSGASADAYLSIALPRASVVAPAEHDFSQNLTRMGLVVTAVIVAAWVGVDLLVRRNPEANKVLVRRLYVAFDTGGVDLLDDVVAPDFVDHDPLPGQGPGLTGLKQAVGLFRAAVPDGEVRVEDVLAEGDKVVAHVTVRGTHRGEFLGVQPTGRAVTAEGVEIFRIAHGKVAEGWSRFGPLASAADSEPAAELESESGDG